MNPVVDIEEARRRVAVRRGYRNWRTRFGETFDEATRAGDLTDPTLMFLAGGNDEAAFYIYDLVMNLLELGSGFEIRELQPQDRMRVMDRYLFLIDRFRFEIMRRLGWLDPLEGEEFSLVELIQGYEKIVPALQAVVPSLGSGHPEYAQFQGISALEKESFIRKLIPKAMDEFSRRPGGGS